MPTYERNELADALMHPEDRSVEYRGNILPLLRRAVTDPYDDISEYEQIEFAVPGMIRDPFLGMAALGQMARGKRQFNPDEVTQTALDVGLLSAPLGLMGGVPRGAVLGANVFHGGPHRFAPEPDFPFGRPRLDKIGTGEGAQAYGHGFYSADAPGVAKQYKQDLSGFDELVLTTSKGKLRGEALDDVDLEVSKYLELGEKDAGQFKHNTVYYAKKLAEKAGRDDVLKRLDEYGPDARKSYEKNVGTLYKLDIPDADVAKYLDYDKPLSEQPKSIQAALSELLEGNATKRLAEAEKALRGLNEGDAGWSAASSEYRRARQNVQNMVGPGHPTADVAGLMKTLAAEYGSPQAASEALRKAGIPGLKYYDAMSRQPKSYVLVNGDPIDPRDSLSQIAEMWLLSSKGSIDNALSAINKNIPKRDNDSALADVREVLRDWAEDPGQIEVIDIKRTRNYVTWDQDVLNRSKMLERDGVTLGANKAPTAAVPGLLSQQELKNSEDQADTITPIAQKRQWGAYLGEV